MINMSLSLRVHLLLISAAAQVCHSTLNVEIHKYVVKHFSQYPSASNMYFCSHNDAIDNFKASGGFLASRKVLSSVDAKSAVDIETPKRTLIFLDASCSEGLQFLDMNKQTVTRQFSWLINVKEVSQVINVLNSSRLGSDSDVLLIAPSYEKDFRIIQLYREITPYPLEILRNYSMSDVMANRARTTRFVFNGEKTNFRGKEIRIGIVLKNFKGGKVPDWPDLLSRSMNESALIMYNLNVAKSLQDVINYTGIVHVFDYWGWALPNGTLAGIINSTASGEVEIDFGGMDTNAQNLKYLDVTFSTYMLRITCMLTQKTAIGTPAALVIPFSTTTWAVFGVIVIVLVICMRLTSVVDPHQRQNDSWGGSIILVFAGIRQNGIPDMATMISSRVTYFILATGTYLVYQYYNVGILNGLVIPGLPPIRTYEQLLASNVEIHARDIGHMRHIPSDSVNPVVDLWARISPPTYVSIEEGLKKVKKGGYALAEAHMMWGDALRKLYTDKETCALTEIKHPYTFQACLGARKFSPMTEVLNRGILIMKERGVLTYLHNYWYASIPNNCIEKIPFIPITIKGMTLAYSILALGIIISATAFVLELWTEKRNFNRTAVRAFVL